KSPRKNPIWRLPTRDATASSLKTLQASWKKTSLISCSSPLLCFNVAIRKQGGNTRNESHQHNNRHRKRNGGMHLKREQIKSQGNKPAHYQRSNDARQAWRSP